MVELAFGAFEAEAELVAAEAEGGGGARPGNTRSVNASMTCGSDPPPGACGFPSHLNSTRMALALPNTPCARSSSIGFWPASLNASVPAFSVSLLRGAILGVRSARAAQAMHGVRREGEGERDEGSDEEGTGGESEGRRYERAKEQK